METGWKREGAFKNNLAGDWMKGLPQADFHQSEHLPAAAGSSS